MKKLDDHSFDLFILSWADLSSQQKSPALSYSLCEANIERDNILRISGYGSPEILFTRSRVLWVPEIAI